MKVTVIGGGSAGLTAAKTLKERLAADVRVLERAQAGEAPGLGIALLPFGMEEVKLMIGPGAFDEFAENCFPISSVTQVFAGTYGEGAPERQARIQENEYFGLKRSVLLSYLSRVVEAAGIDIEYGAEIDEERVLREKENADLLVGADGAGSVVRQTFASAFKPTMEDATSRFAWLELEGHLDQFMFGYMYVPDHGLIRITAYPHGQGQSSAVVTHGPGMTGFLDAPGMLDAEGFISEEGLKVVNDIFAAGVGGRKLKGLSRWRRFRATSNRHAVFDNVALVGDAFATVHYETGWGTSAAMQESRTLGHILAFAKGKGKSFAEALDLFDRKTMEFTRGLREAAVKTMREVDAQEELFRKLGATEFLQLKTP
jgi:anthraniloyl-CoA monooxygenase